MNHFSMSSVLPSYQISSDLSRRASIIVHAWESLENPSVLKEITLALYILESFHGRNTRLFIQERQLFTASCLSQWQSIHDTHQKALETILLFDSFLKKRHQTSLVPSEHLVQKSIALEIPYARSESDLMIRANRRSQRARLLLQKQRTQINSNVTQAQSTLLKVSAHQTPLLQQHDLRQYLGIKKNTTASWGQTLRMAAVFDEVYLNELLPSFILQLGKPVGFDDRDHRVILWESPSSIASQEARLQQDLILQHLQQEPLFKHITKLKVVVRSQK